jgi:hypothetical protein
VGPYVAATGNGEVAHIGRFKNRDHFAADNGTAPVEAPSVKATFTGYHAKASAGSTAPSTWRP